MEKIIVIGGIGTAIVIADQIYDAHKRFGADIEVMGLALDDLSHGPSINGYPILCPIREAYEKYKSFEDVKFIYSLYRPDLMRERSQLLYGLNIPSEKFINFIHPSVMLAKSARIGFGNVLLANVVVNCNVHLGNFNTVNSGTLLGHDIVVGNNNYFAGQVCVGSGLSIGNENFFGLNTSIRNGIGIGNNNIVGMSSNITKNVGNENILYGNPAQIKPKLNNIIR
ncbi:MAG: sialic acid O-acetyltransferase [Proteiniphilum sp.]|uniref:sialic acid O-acetyltransferase n=1 Tax=Proteiniphilum sp. TaxID=1926877 RepID=UPI0026AF83BD|nr:sialic acid O-acetyltransferase [Proteiniphilum sp.]MEA5127270.1 sialic acid O-acetyltransferase [Proteiniphilum sp.]